MRILEQTSSSQIRAMHQCRICGHLSKREDMSEIAIYSGVVECPKCGHGDCLNVTIEDIEKAPPVKL